MPCTARAKCEQEATSLHGTIPSVDDLARVVDVVDEVVQRADPLGEAALDALPFLAVEHTRDEIQRERAVVGGAVPAAGLERDPLLHEDRIPSSPGLDQARRAELGERLDERYGGRSGPAVVLEQLVQERRRGGVAQGRCPACTRV